MKLMRYLFLLLLFPVAASAQRYAPPHYTLTLLPGPANAISDMGWIVGETQEGAYRWKDGSWERLPKMNLAFGVNNRGDVVGSYNGERWEPRLG